MRTRPYLAFREQCSELDFLIWYKAVILYRLAIRIMALELQWVRLSYLVQGSYLISTRYQVHDFTVIDVDGLYVQEAIYCINWAVGNARYLRQETRIGIVLGPLSSSNNR